MTRRPGRNGGAAHRGARSADVRERVPIMPLSASLSASRNCRSPRPRTLAAASGGRRSARTFSPPTSAAWCRSSAPNAPHTGHGVMGPPTPRSADRSRSRLQAPARRHRAPTRPIDSSALPPPAREWRADRGSKREARRSRRPPVRTERRPPVCIRSAHGHRGRRVRGPDAGGTREPATVRRLRDGPS
jgi:hypothetical protein